MKWNNKKFLIGYFVACCIWTDILFAAEPKVNFEKTPHSGIQPQAIVDKSGTLHLLYHKGQPREGDLYYTTRAKGKKNFTAPLKVNNIAGSACCIGSIFRARTAIDQNGIVHVLWNGSFGFVKKQWEKKGKQRTPEEFTYLFYTCLADDRKSFRQQVNLNRNTYGLDGNGSITVDRNGVIRVFWHANIKGRPDRMAFMVQSNNKGKSFSIETPVTRNPIGACECCTLEAFSSVSGKTFVAYRTAEKTGRDTVIFSTEKQNNSFKEIHRHQWKVFTCPASTFAFAEDAQRIYAAWETKGHIYTKDILSSSASIKVSSGNKNCKYPSIAINSRRDRLTTWSTNTGWGEGGYIQYQLTNRNGTVISQSNRPGHSPAAYSFSNACTLTTGDFIIFY